MSTKRFTAIATIAALLTLAGNSAFAVNQPSDTASDKRLPLRRS